MTKSPLPLPSLEVRGGGRKFKPLILWLVFLASISHSAAVYLAPYPPCHLVSTTETLLSFWKF